MVISFKDQPLESRLTDTSKEQGISASLLARRDLARWYWVLDDHVPIELEPNEFLAVCSLIKSTKLFDEPSRIKKLPFLIEDCIRSNSKIERFGVDVDLLCAKLRKATSLQLAGLVDRSEAYPSKELWSRFEMESNMVDILIDGLEATMKGEYQDQLDEFFHKHNAKTWIIASDYSMGNPAFTHDAMVFVLIPYSADLFPPTKIEAELPVDFKDCGKTIKNSYLSYLRSAPAFSFVFLLDRSQRLFSSEGIAEQALRNCIAMMKAWPNASEPPNSETIRKVELCFRESGTKSFLRKVNEVTILAILGAFVGLVASRKANWEGIVWAPDRDNMNGVWDGLASSLFYANLHSARHRRNLSETYTCGTAIEQGTAKKQWFDAYVRLADYLATPAASMTRLNEEPGKFEKCNQIVQAVFADNPNLIAQRLAFVADHGKIAPDCQLIRITKEPCGLQS